MIPSLFVLGLLAAALVAFGLRNHLFLLYRLGQWPDENDLVFLWRRRTGRPDRVDPPPFTRSATALGAALGAVLFATAAAATLRPPARTIDSYSLPPLPAQVERGAVSRMPGSRVMPTREVPAVPFELVAVRTPAAAPSRRGVAPSDAQAGPVVAPVAAVPVAVEVVSDVETVAPAAPSVAPTLTPKPAPAATPASVPSESSPEVDPGDDAVEPTAGSGTQQDPAPQEPTADEPTAAEPTPEEPPAEEPTPEEPAPEPEPIVQVTVEETVASEPVAVSAGVGDGSCTGVTVDGVTAGCEA